MNVLVTTAGGVEKAELIRHLSSLLGSEGSVIACDSEDTPITEMYQSIHNVIYINTGRFREEGYLELMDSICEKYEVDYYMSIDTYECILLSNEAYKYNSLSKVKGSWGDSLIESVHLAKSSINSCLYDYLKKNSRGKRFNKVWMDKYTTAISVNNLDKEHIEDAFGKIVEAGYSQVVFKPDDSNGSRGLRVVDLLYHERDLAQSRSPYFIPVTYLDAFEIWKENLIVQPYYSGTNYNVDCYKDSKGNIHVVGQKVLGNRWGQVLGSEFVVEGDPEFEVINQWAEFISEALRLNKNFNFELSYDTVAKKLKLVEVNPRISAVLAQTIGTEVDLVSIQLNDAAGSLDKLNLQPLTKAINKSYLMTARSIKKS